VAGHATVGVDDDLAAVRPQSPRGPPTTKMPVGLMKKVMSSFQSEKLSSTGLTTWLMTSAFSSS
jgi:hypothetical protein